MHWDASSKTNTIEQLADTTAATDNALLTLLSYRTMHLYHLHTILSPLSRPLPSPPHLRPDSLLLSFLSLSRVSQLHESLHLRVSE